MTRRATIEELARWLRARDGFAVIGHVSPDGDAAGSCVAVAMALRAMGKRAFCLPARWDAEDVFALCGRGWGDRGRREAAVFPGDGACAGCVGRGPAGRRAGRCSTAAPARAVLDHHATNPGFGDVCLIDGGRAATGELALELIEALGRAAEPRDGRVAVHRHLHRQRKLQLFLHDAGDDVRSGEADHALSQSTSPG